MRKNDITKMTIVEQLILIKEETCDFACMFKEYAQSEYEDIEKRQEYLNGYCQRCPLYRLDVSESNPEHSFGE